MTHRIVINDEDELFRPAAIALAKQLALPLRSTYEGDCDYSLEFTVEGLQLVVDKNPLFTPLSIDFLSGKAAYRRAHGGGHKQLLTKACGVKPNKPLFIIDATAGLGQDAFVLACLGCRVLMLEQSAIVAALLQDALQRLQQNPSGQQLHLTLININAIQYLNACNPETKPDVVYCDPMFPERKKTAQVNKGMQILQDLIPCEASPEKLLRAALTCCKQRVVVKRPRHAPAISHTPDFSFQGQSTRFDVYVT